MFKAFGDGLGVELKRKVWPKLVAGYHLFSGMEACAVCSAPIRERIAVLAVCQDCFRSIPWITEVRCEVCGRGIDCNDCRRRIDTHFEQNRSAVRYDDCMKDWLARWKYRGDEKMAAFFGDMLLHPAHFYIERGLSFDLITFVPVSPVRYEERGFNQAEELAKGIGRRIRVPVRDLLVRKVHTEKQSFKSRQDRLRDLDDVFAMQPTHPNMLEAGRPLRIMLIDDVYTTGSTMNQCARLLRLGLGASVYGLTWAR